MTTRPSTTVRYETRTTIDRPVSDVFARLADLMEARPEYVLEADRDRTIVHHVAEGGLFGMMRLMKPVAILMARGEWAGTVESLRRSLESDEYRERRSSP